MLRGQAPGGTLEAVPAWVCTAPVFPRTPLGSSRPRAGFRSALQQGALASPHSLRPLGAGGGAAVGSTLSVGCLSTCSDVPVHAQPCWL